MTIANLRVICCLLLAWTHRSAGETARLLLTDMDDTASAGNEAVEGSDSLRPALEAISRRQRDLAGRPYENYGGLGRYRFEEAKRNGGGSELAPEDLEFLSMDGGQPEDIGYGYQRGSGRYEGSIPMGGSSRLGGREQTAAGARALERLLVEYLEGAREEEEDGPEEEIQDEDVERRSAFRERGAKRLDHSFSGSPLTTAFRERLRTDEGEEGEEGEEDDEERRKRFLAVVKRLEEAEEEEEDDEDGSDADGIERRRRKKSGRNEIRGGDDEDSGYEDDVNKLDAYLDLLEDLWDRYKTENAGKSDSSNCDKDKNEAKEAVKRGRDSSRSRNRGGDGGPSYDYFNSPIGWMGGGAGGYDGFGRRRRAGGLEEDEKLRNLLYAMKSSGYVPRPQFVEEEGVDPEGALYRKREPEPETWFSAREKPRRWMTAGEAEEEAGEFGKGAIETPVYMYGPRQRRFPVAKRAFKRSYVTPQTVAGASAAASSAARIEGPKRRKKEIKTDPKVAEALSHIFGGANKKNATNATEMTKGDTHPKEVEKKEEVKGDDKKKNVQEEKGIKEKSVGRGGEKEVVGDSKTKEGKEVGKKEVKKSIDWSEYFGMDRRRKKSEGESGAEEEEKRRRKKKRDGEDGRTAEEEKLDDWLLNQYYKTLSMSTNAAKRKRGPSDRRRVPYAIARGEEEGGEEGEENGLDNMDGKLRRVEDAIVEEAIKDTGAHEGTPGGRKEAEEVRGRVLSRLAAAYSLEKMRKALGEFKASLQEDEEEDKEGGERISDGHAVKMPGSRRVGEGGEEEGTRDEREEEEEGRGGGGVEGEEQDEEKRKKKKKRDEEEGVFLGPPIAEPMSEGYMGGPRGVDPRENDIGGECPALERLTTNCAGIGDLAGDYQHLFLDLCNWHEVCYICGSATSNRAPVNSCDITFLREVESLCHGHEDCRQSGHRMAVALRALRGRGGKPFHHHQSKSASLCWQHPCLADYLTRRRRR